MLHVYICVYILCVRGMGSQTNVSSSISSTKAPNNETNEYAKSLWL